VFCGDDFLWTDEAAIRAAAKAIERPRFGEPFEFWSIANIAMCATFGAERIPAEDRRPVVSAIPTLILSGEYDPITPQAFGAQVHATLERSTHVVFPGIGHGVVGSGACADRIANRFLDDPTAAVDPACAMALPLPIFRN
jgi:pimeloyl-ACP methyl ester carboxylesterase